MPEFLQTFGYKKISIVDACLAGDIGPEQLVVWVNREGTWTKLSDVAKLWGKRRGRESLCRGLVTRLLGMSDAQYESMKDAFDEEEAFERVGIYRSNDNYAIVVRLPKDNKLRLAGIGAGIGAAGLVLGLATHTIRQKSKWIEDFTLLNNDAALLASLYGTILDKEIENSHPYYPYGENFNEKVYHSRLE